MKYTWNQPNCNRHCNAGRWSRPMPASATRTQRAEAIRARANRLYMVGELALAAQLLMELELQASRA